MADTTDDFLGDISADLGGWSNNPSDWEQDYKAASAKYGVPEAILKAGTAVESSDKAGVTSRAGAQGLAQIMPGSVPAGANPWKPADAIDSMGKILSSRYAQTKSWTDALQAYNGGPGYTKLQPGDAGYAENSSYVPKIAAAIKAQGGDPGILTGTQVSSSPAGVASNSTSTYTAPKGPATTDDFLNDISQDLAPPQEQAPAPAPAAAAPPPVDPAVAARLQSIITNPPQPDAPPPPPPPQAPPTAVASPQAPPPVPPQAPAGPAPVALAPPPPVVNTSDPRWIATHPDEVQAQANLAPAPQDAQIPQPPGSPPLPLPQAPQAPASPPSGFTPFTPSGVSPNINPTWDGQKEWANAISLGAAKPLASAVGGGIAALQGGNFSKTFAADQAQQAAAQARYEAANPANAGLSGVVGPLPAELATGGAVTQGLRALGPAGRFLAGETGTATGIGGQAVAAPGRANAMGNVLSKTAAGTLQGGLMGAEGSQVSPGQDPFITQVIKGAAAGGGLGLLGGSLGRVLLPAVKPAVADITNRMAGLGVDVPVSKLVSGSLPGMVAGNGDAHALQQFTQAVGREIGSTEPTLTSDAVDRAMDRIGDGLDAVGLRTGVAASTPQIAAPLMTGLRGILQRAQDNLDVGTPARNAVFQQVNRMMDRITQGDISGPQYQRMTQTGSGLMNMIKSRDNPIIQEYGRDIRQVFDQGLQDTATARGDTAAVGELQTLRNQYRIASGVQPIADKAGATGILNPLAVANKFAGDTPGTPMKTLADGGRLLPTPDSVGDPKSAGPALWNFAKHAVLPSLVLGGAGYAGEGLVGAGAGLAVGLGAEKVAEKAIDSRAYRNMLTGAPSRTGDVLGARIPTAVSTNLLNRPQTYGSQTPVAPVNPFLAGQQQ